MKKEVVGDYSWILRGKQRKKVILALPDEPTIPTAVKETSALSLNNVSDVLRSFTKRKLARCLNPEAKTGRLYVLTEKGKIIRDTLRKSESKTNAYSLVN